MASSHPKFVRWAVLVGIVVVLNIFFLSARTLVAEMPNYDDYCPATRMTPPASIEACAEIGGTWVVTSNGQVTAVTKPNTEGFCDMQPLFNECQPLFDTAFDDYQLMSFLVMVGFGVAALIAGVFPIGSSIVSSGLSFGGVLALVIASAGYWHEAGGLLKLGISLVALVILLYVGAQRFKD